MSRMGCRRPGGRALMSGWRLDGGEPFDDRHCGVARGVFGEGPQPGFGFDRDHSGHLRRVVAEVQAVAGAYFEHLT